MSNPIEKNCALFDISTLFSFGCYRGLFVDKHLHLWTEDKNGRYRRLANQWSLPAGEYPYSLSELRERITLSPIFANFLQRVRIAINEYQEMKNSLKGKFVIAIVNDGAPVFPRVPQIFETREEADIKLIRYQQLNPDARFCLFKCEGELRSTEVVLE